MLKSDRSAIIEQDSLLEDEEIHLFINSNKKSKEIEPVFNSLSKQKSQFSSTMIMLPKYINNRTNNFKHSIVSRKIQSRTNLKSQKQLSRIFTSKNNFSKQIIKNPENMKQPLQSFSMNKQFCMNSSEKKLMNTRAIMLKLNRQIKLSTLQSNSLVGIKELGIKPKFSLKALKKKSQVSQEVKFQKRYGISNPFQPNLLETQYL